MAIPLTVPFYIVVQGHHEPYVAERNVEDCTWASTVKDIADGQFDRLTRILEIATGRDTTEQMLREALELRAHRGDEYSHSMFVTAEMHLGTRTARALVR